MAYITKIHLTVIGHIKDAIDLASQLASNRHCPVTFEFNGVSVLCTASTTKEEVLADYYERYNARFLREDTKRGNYV